MSLINNIESPNIAEANLSHLGLTISLNTWVLLEELEKYAGITGVI